jgi:hypothetical protein
MGLRHPVLPGSHRADDAPATHCERVSVSRPARCPQGRGEEGGAQRRRRDPAPRGRARQGPGVGRHGRSPGFRISLLPALPTRTTGTAVDSRPIPSAQWLCPCPSPRFQRRPTREAPRGRGQRGHLPVSSPVTVAGAAPDSHRLPSEDPFGHRDIGCQIRFRREPARGPAATAGRITASNLWPFEERSRPGGFSRLRRLRLRAAR